MNQNDHDNFKVNNSIDEWIAKLLRSDLHWLGHPLLKGLRFAWRHRSGPAERHGKEKGIGPSGPFATKRKDQMGDLLLWVPRRIESFIIDDLTGGFGYSHITVDTGEVDLPTGKAVMAEVTIGQTVVRQFQEEYSNRACARIPLWKTGLNVEAFVACIKSRLGEPYDDLEALTLGEIDDPAKQVCSSIAADCLPETTRVQIANARRLRLLRRAAVSVHSPTNAVETKVFVSPNGFAEFYGAPEGHKLHEMDVPIEPRLVNSSVRGVVRKHGWKAAAILGAAGALVAFGLLLIGHTKLHQMI